MPSPTFRGHLTDVVLLCAAICCLFDTAARAQGATATLTGTVVDESESVVPGVSITLVNVDTAARRETTTSAAGHYAFPALPPGRYTLRAQVTGFAPVQMDNIVLTVNAERVLRVTLGIAKVGESVTVAAGLVSHSPAVSTVVDRQFVENLPLSGRSLQSLLELTPGVTLFRANPGQTNGGQFSVNGQRTDANTFLVDGVSANSGISTGSGTLTGPSAAGGLPALTSLGSTQSLVSIDALQEFRVQTSTYAPEFGRTPGGQISMVTRSGTNAFHGSVSEYFRDEQMDANDWFANSRSLPKAKLRQHDFGGTLGGPLLRDRTFFFASYEGLRLDLPQTRIIGVPSEETRLAAPPAVRQLLNAFPRPTGGSLGVGISEFAASYSDPAESDTTSVRLDHTLGTRLTLFGRYSHSPSISNSRTLSLSTISQNDFRNDSVTLAKTWVVSNAMTNDLRVNWTRTSARQYLELDSFGGAVPPPDEAFFPAPLTRDNAWFIINLAGTSNVRYGTGNDNRQRQLNLVEAFTWVKGAHHLKLGADYRRISPTLGRAGRNFTNVIFGSVANALAGTVATVQIGRGAEGSEAQYQNFSAFGQDTWSVTPRMTLTYGLRWEVNPSPTSPNDHLPLTANGVGVTEPVRFAPKNTQLWATTYNNFAPRLGVAYQVSERSGRETVLRGGFGVFYDTGFGISGNAFDNFTHPYFASKIVQNQPYPLPAAAAAPILPGADPAPQFYLTDPNVKLPFTYQWNASVERALGSSQTVTISYVGAAGRRLLRTEVYNPFYEGFTPRLSTQFFTNGSTSDYKALQLQFQRRLSRGFQALVNYTLSKSQDMVSDDSPFLSTTAPGSRVDHSKDYGPSDYDVRHLGSGGVTYDLPTVPGPRLIRAVFGDWGIDSLVRARSAFPLTPLFFIPFPPGSNYFVRPNVVPGVPMIIEGDSPGGRRINRDAFSAPPAGTAGDYVRGSLRGFSAWQIDLTLRRQFGLGRGMRLQFRGELFNVFNHPNFADPLVASNTAVAIFGRATQTLNRGLGGLNPLYQMGGARSGQLAMKLLF